MTESFQQVEKLPGTVYVDGEELGKCRYEFTYSPYDTNSMEIALLGPPEGIPSAPDMPPVKVVTDFSWGRYEMDLNRELAGGSRLNMKEFHYRSPVDEFRKVQHFSEDDPAEVGIGYLFPLTSVTDCTTLATQHGKHGYVRGKYLEEEEVFDPLDNSFSIESPVGEISLGDEFDFGEGGDDLYPATELVRRSHAGFEQRLEEASVEKIVESTRSVAYNLFHFLSLVERTRINWHTERLLVKSENGDPVCKTTRHRWRPPPSSNYRPDRNALPSHRQTLRMLLKAYWDCSSKKQTDIDEIIDNFKIANSGDTIQSNFIHWHSCLDFFKPLYFNDLEKDERNRVENNMSFSMQLVRVFDEAAIEVEDLLGEETISKIRRAIDGEGSAPDLRFTELRNEYIHDGFHAFRGIEQEAIDLRRKMRAIGERLLTDYMGIDHRDTSLGDPYYL